MARSDRVSVLIDGVEFTGWRSVDINLSMDTFSSVEFTAPFEPEHAEFREVFRPFRFPPLQVLVDGVPLFTGTLVGVDPDHSVDSSTVTVSGYSLPAILEDCTAPANTVPLEFKKLGLRAIAETVARPFGINVEFRAEEGGTFDKVKLDVDKRVHEFLAHLARQRNLVLTSTPEGALLCWQSVEPGSPVARLSDSEQPVTRVAAAFNPQEYFSEITGFARAKRGRAGSKYTVQNPWLTTILRPLSIRLEDTEKGDAPEATRARLGRMFANMAAFTVDVATWRDPQGALWTPNTTLMLNAPKAMVYRETELLIRSVVLHQDDEITAAELGLVLPGAFAGEIPEVLPWDE